MRVSYKGGKKVDVESKRRWLSTALKVKAFLRPPDLSIFIQTLFSVPSVYIHARLLPYNYQSMEASDTRWQAARQLTQSYRL